MGGEGGGGGAGGRAIAKRYKLWLRSEVAHHGTQARFHSSQFGRFVQVCIPARHVRNRVNAIDPSLLHSACHSWPYCIGQKSIVNSLLSRVDHSRKRREFD